MQLELNPLCGIKSKLHLMEKLLIVEDDEGIRTQLKWALSKSYTVMMAIDRQAALQSFKKEKPNVVILDLGLPPCEDGATEGLTCLKNFITLLPQTKVIIVTGNNERENALHAIGLGAYDFYQKPVDLEVLKVILQRAFNLVSLEKDYKKLKEVSGTNAFEGMIGCSPAMQKVFSFIKKVSSSDVTVLITGESGTGKELVARAIHRNSLRKNGHFVPINCSAIPENLIESELFGYEKGAFTDAKSQKIGLVEKASGGTLFLDEIGELPIHLQVKLLRFIQERRIQRIGGSEEIEVDLRIIAATNINLEKKTKSGAFRDDLFYRINVVNIILPPLKERGDDILILAKSFLSRFCQENQKKINGFSPRSIAAIKLHKWPGNVRELENKLQRAVIITDKLQLEPKDLSLSHDYINDNDKTVTTTYRTLKETRAEAEIDAIKKTLTLYDGNISHAAKLLNISRPSLHDLLKKYGLKSKPA